MGAWPSTQPPLRSTRQRLQPQRGSCTKVTARRILRSRAHGHLQHEEPGPAGPEEGPQQDGLQGHGGRVRGRHQQRDPGRTVPGHQGVHPQPEGGAEGGEEPGEGGGEAGRAAPGGSAGRRRAGPAATVPGPGAQPGHDRAQLPPGGLHLRPARAGRGAAGVQGPAAPGHRPAPHRQVPRPHQPRLRPLCQRRLPGRAVRPGGALPEPPAPHLRWPWQDAGRGRHLTWPGDRRPSQPLLLFSTSETLSGSPG